MRFYLLSPFLFTLGLGFDRRAVQLEVRAGRRSCMSGFEAISQIELPSPFVSGGLTATKGNTGLAIRIQGRIAASRD